MFADRRVDIAEFEPGCSLGFWRSTMRRRSRRRPRLLEPVLAGALQDDVERELDGPWIGDAQEALDGSEVAGRPFLQVEDPVRPQVQRLLDPVLDDEHRVALVRQGPQDGQQPLGGGWIEIRQRLVDDVEAGPHHQDPGHGEELSLAAGERARLAAEQWLDPGLGGDLAQSDQHLVPWHGQVLGPERQLGFDRRPDDLLGRVLEHRADGQRDVAQLQLGGRPARRP